MNVLTDLKQHVTCAVCKDVFKQPTLITTCLHVFCSACIREDACPTCTVSFTAKKLKPSTRDATLIATYLSNYKIAMTSFTEKLCKLVNAICVAEAEILFKILHNETIPALKNKLKVKRDAVYKISYDLTEASRFRENDLQFLLQIVLDLMEGEYYLEQKNYLLDCFERLKKWDIPLDMLQKARRIAIEKKDPRLLAYSFNHPIATYASVKKAATTLKLSDKALFFHQILFLSRASEQLINQASSTLFSLLSDNLDEYALRELLFSDLPKKFLSKCINIYVSKAVANNRSFISSLCSWIKTSSQNSYLDKLKRKAIYSLLEHLDIKECNSWTDELFCDLHALDSLDPTVGYLWEKYLHLLNQAQYNQNLYLPISKEVSHYSAHELEFFHIMVNSIADEKLPINTALQYKARLLSYYECREFMHRLPHDYSTAQKLIDSLPSRLRS